VSYLNVHIPGPEIDATKFIGLMYPRIDGLSDFDYPVDRLLELQGILSAEVIRTPISISCNGIPMRYVIKRSLITLTTIGCLMVMRSMVKWPCNFSFYYFFIVCGLDRGQVTFSCPDPTPPSTLYPMYPGRVCDGCTTGSGSGAGIKHNIYYNLIKYLYYQLKEKKRKMKGKGIQCPFLSITSK